ncbi:MAG: phosphosulfolactate synthase, partial [Nocardioidaceae bacterium]
IGSCAGGTLLEISWAQGKEREFLGWARDVGFSYVEVSRGVAPMPREVKQELIRAAAAWFEVLAEVGSKDPGTEPAPDMWADEIASDLRAGARWVIAEGRESGTVGLYRADGSVREDVVAAAVRGGGTDRVLFEAPRKDQQAWLIRKLGPEVNLANIAPDDALALETLRRGLRADTFQMAMPPVPS